jgi:hypothetical protein
MKAKSLAKYKYFGSKTPIMGGEFDHFIQI